MCVLQTGNERLLSQCKIPFPDTLLHLVQIRFQTLSKQHRHNKIARHRQNRIALQIKNLSRTVRRRRRNVAWGLCVALIGVSVLSYAALI